MSQPVTGSSSILRLKIMALYGQSAFASPFIPWWTLELLPAFGRCKRKCANLSLLWHLNCRPRCTHTPPRHLHDLGLPAPLSGGACRGQRAGHVQQSLSSPFELDVTVRVLQVVNVRRRGSPLPHFLKSVSPTPHSAHRASGSKAHILLQETYFCLFRMRRFFSLGSPSSVSHPSPPDHIFKKRSAALLRCESHI